MSAADISIIPNTVLGGLRLKGRYWKTLASNRDSMDRFLRNQKDAWRAAGWDRETGMMGLAEWAFAGAWVDQGSIVYELSHDIASMFSLTTAPPLDLSTSPHQFFVVKVPRDLLPASGTVESSDTWLLVSPDAMLVVPDYDTTAELSITFHGLSDLDPERSISAWRDSFQDPRHLKMAILSVRYLSNLIHYISEYKSQAKPIGRVTPKSRSTFVVKPPCDVVVTRDFRDAARAAVASESVGGIRRALAHVVRGHWRNQPCGHGRNEIKRTWVRPHKRGDESLGRVVQRIERIR